MEVNVGKFDKKVRITVGVLLIIVSLASFMEYITYGPGIKWTSLVLGIVLVATGVTGKCMIYKLAGMDTCEME